MKIWKLLPLYIVDTEAFASLSARTPTLKSHLHKPSALGWIQKHVSSGKQMDGFATTKFNLTRAELCSLCER